MMKVLTFTIFINLLAVQANAQYQVSFVQGNDTVFLKTGTDSLFTKSGGVHTYSFRLPIKATNLVGFIAGLQTMLASNVETINSTVSGKANITHGHAISDVTGLQTALDAKASAAHGHVIADVTGLQSAIDAKVSVVPGKELSTNDYTTAEKNKLAAIAAGATANSTDATLLSRANHTGTQAASTITGLASVATSGSYNDLANKPAAPSIVVLNSDVTNNNAVANTIADVTALSFPVTAGLTYKFRFVIFYTAAVTTTGSRWTINGPATSLLHYRSEYSLTATSRTFNEGLNAYNLPAASNATSIAASNMAVIEGIITPSANGTVIARFASEVISSAIVAKAKSYVEYQAY